ncbi:hypothetical protein [Kribbella shirazensis]|uniref:Uncharacterized protein n=1 Tax=Kribbella shirazensis TaxID=1105143 RepID=A0A7X5VIY8_9ACTN|nr:hypothetical protein [Kribbella shirazensis]NIK62083.1 hypothetical protein [Kribbella shirazensis]
MAVARGVMEGAEDGAGRCDLLVGPTLISGRDPAFEKREDVAAGLVLTEVLRGRRETVFRQEFQEVRGEGGPVRAGAAYRVTDPHDPGRQAASGEWLLGHAIVGRA